MDVLSSLGYAGSADTMAGADARMPWGSGLTAGSARGGSPAGQVPRNPFFYGGCSQVVRRLVVAQLCAGSIPVTHPTV
jgi:hypothetical protein